MEHYVGANVAWRRDGRVSNVIAAFVIFVIGWTVSTVMRGIRQRVLARELR
jgi:hypothetical protein